MGCLRAIFTISHSNRIWSATVDNTNIIWYTHPSSTCTFARLSNEPTTSCSHSSSSPSSSTTSISAASSNVLGDPQKLPRSFVISELSFSSHTTLTCAHKWSDHVLQAAFSCADVCGEGAMAADIGGKVLSFGGRGMVGMSEGRGRRRTILGGSGDGRGIDSDLGIRRGGASCEHGCWT